MNSERTDVDETASRVYEVHRGLLGRQVQPQLNHEASRRRIVWGSDELEWIELGHDGRDKFQALVGQCATKDREDPLGHCRVASKQGLDACLLLRRRDSWQGKRSQEQDESSRARKHP